MIGFLSGFVKSTKQSKVLVLVNGIGYDVFVPGNSQFKIGESIELFIHTHVREDAITLFGFQDESSLDLFEKLLTVSGVGPKSAQAIISVASADIIKKAIDNSNLNFFTAISGIGRKSAQKIIIELKSKLSQSDMDMTNLESNNELSLALTQLGLTRSEIITILPQVDLSADLAIQIKQALKLLRQ